MQSLKNNTAWMRPLSPLIGALALLSAPSHAQPTSCEESDKACVAKAYSSHKVRNASFWAEELAKPLGARIGPAPTALVDYIALGNMLDGFHERPATAKLDAGFIADLQAAMNEIPAEVWRLATHRLVGIYFVENLGGSGYTDYVLDKRGAPSHGFVVMDYAVLRTLQANAWATWKENTPFKAWTPGTQTLSATIAAPANNNRKSAIQYILLHELAHVISVGRNVHPNWDAPPPLPNPIGRYPFFDLSWSVATSKKDYLSHFDAQWPQRKDVVYYRAPKLDKSDMVPTYQNLAKTNFPTLYAATHPGDDFAESFVSYVHTVRMGKPWNIIIGHGDKTVLRLDSCWEEKRCAQKRKALETILAGP